MLETNCVGDDFQLLKPTSTCHHFNSQFSVDSGTEYYIEYDESTQKPDEHTETPWEDENDDFKDALAENHNDLNGYMRFLNKKQ